MFLELFRKEEEEEEEKDEDDGSFEEPPFWALENVIVLPQSRVKTVCQDQTSLVSKKASKTTSKKWVVRQDAFRLVPLMRPPQDQTFEHVDNLDYANSPAYSLSSASGIDANSVYGCDDPLYDVEPATLVVEQVADEQFSVMALYVSWVENFWLSESEHSDPLVHTRILFSAGEYHYDSPGGRLWRRLLAEIRSRFRLCNIRLLFHNRCAFVIQNTYRLWKLPYVELEIEQFSVLSYFANSLLDDIHWRYQEYHSVSYSGRLWRQVLAAIRHRRHVMRLLLDERCASVIQNAYRLWKLQDHEELPFIEEVLPFPSPDSRFVEDFGVCVVPYKIQKVQHETQVQLKPVALQAMQTVEHLTIHDIVIPMTYFYVLCRERARLARLRNQYDREGTWRYVADPLEGHRDQLLVEYYLGWLSKVGNPDNFQQPEALVQWKAFWKVCDEHPQLAQLHCLEMWRVGKAKKKIELLMRANCARKKVLVRRAAVASIHSLFRLPRVRHNMRRLRKLIDNVILAQSIFRGRSCRRSIRYRNLGQPQYVHDSDYSDGFSEDGFDRSYPRKERGSYKYSKAVSRVSRKELQVKYQYSQTLLNCLENSS